MISAGIYHFGVADWLLIDGSSLIFRAFYGVPQSVTAPDGRPVNAVRGFLDNLARLLDSRRPSRLAVAEDADWRPGWRVELIPSYKLHRTAEPVPPALIPQMVVINHVLDAIGIDRAGVPDFEAEDVIATWAHLIPGSAEIVSGDRDLFGLVRDPDRQVLYPERGGPALVDEAEVTRRYGIPGRTYPDFAILRGDPSDGLPGVPGVGAKTAADLIRRFGGVEGIIAGSRLSDPDKDYLRRAYEVVRPVTTVPVQLPPGRRPRYPAEPERLVRLSAENGLDGSVGRLLKSLSQIAGEP